MALAPYFRRAAVAAAQIIAGFSEDAIRSRVDRTTLGIAIGSDAAQTPEGRALIDLTVRLAARLYPRVRISAGDGVKEWGDLARLINPDIEIADEGATFTLALGNVQPPEGPTLFLGCDGWNALLSPTGPQPIGDASNPFGAGVAACLGLANVFRSVFLENGSSLLDEDLRISATTLARDPSFNPTLDGVNLSEFVLIGAGAIGNAVTWALSHVPGEGTCHLVDHETVEPDNLQRYVLATMADCVSPKVDIAARYLDGGIKAVPHQQTWGEFASAHGHSWERVLVGVDSAAARRQIQASLPRWIGNAWTQPGDLGVSVHPSLDAGGCMHCLYLPKGEVPSEDKLIADALRLETQEHQMMVRVALFNNAPLPMNLVDLVANNLNIATDLVLTFQNKSLRQLYRGLCGGALVPLENLGRPAQDVHVPVAHQSALAGVVLAARLVASALAADPQSTEVTQINILRPVGEFLTHPVAKDPRGICICQDPDYRRAYAAKYPAGQGRVVALRPPS